VVTLNRGERLTGDRKVGLFVILHQFYRDGGGFYKESSVFISVEVLSQCVGGFAFV